jgi:small GTP-binding protein
VLRTRSVEAVSGLPDNAGAGGRPTIPVLGRRNNLAIGLVVGALILTGILTLALILYRRRRTPTFAPLLVDTVETYTTSGFDTEKSAPPVVVIGSPSVGKTSIINCLIGKTFSSVTAPTTGAAFHVYRAPPGMPDVQLWDTPGMDRYRSQNSAFYSEAVGALVVFDLTSYTTFRDLDSWVDEFGAASRGNPAIVICGNKGDLQEAREVDEDDITSFCRRHDGVPYFEVSAYTGERIPEAMHCLLEMIGTDLAVETCAVEAPSERRCW